MEFRKLDFKLKRINQLKNWHMNNATKELEAIYYGQLHFLFYIEDHPGCTQKDLAHQFTVSKAAVTKSVKRMISAGLITRSTSEEDERQFHLCMTDVGSSLVHEAKSKFDQVEQLTFKGFSEEDLEQFNSYIDRIISNLETDYTRNKTMGELKKINRK